MRVGRLALTALVFVGGASAYIGLIGSAMAADVELPSYQPPPAPIYSWTGCHFGIEGGGAWGSSKHTQDDPKFAGFGFTLSTPNVHGALFGGTLGCDYQIGHWLVGAENDLSWSTIKGTGYYFAPYNPANTAETSEKWLDTLRLRVGVAGGGWLFYATGGLAFSNVGVTICSPLAPACGSGSHVVTGWTAGAGISYGFWKNWSVKVEYLYIDFARTFFPEFPEPTGVYLARNVTLSNNVVRVGLDYKFDWFGPAPYGQ